MDIGNDFLLVLRYALIGIGIILIIERFFYFLAKYRRWNALAQIRRQEKDFQEVKKHIESNSRALGLIERWSLAQFGEIISFWEFLGFSVFTLVVFGIVSTFLKGLDLSRNLSIILLTSSFGLIYGLFASITAFNDLKNYRRVIPFVWGIFCLIVSLVGFYHLYSILARA